MLRPVLKVLAAWIVFVALHFAYKTAPCGLFHLLGCPYESIFQHMKMAFFGYTMVSAVEIAVIRAARPWPAIRARLLTTFVLSYLVFIIWYLVPGLIGPMESVAGEIIYSNVVLAICLVFAVILERELEKLGASRAFSAVVVVLYAIAAVQFSVLAFKQPPVDVFAPHEHGDHGDGHEDHEGHVGHEGHEDHGGHGH